jgi:DNA gyrase/topoisomerase IV subunit B
VVIVIPLLISMKMVPVEDNGRGIPVEFIKRRSFGIGGCND